MLLGTYQFIIILYDSWFKSIMWNGLFTMVRFLSLSPSSNELGTSAFFWSIFACYILIFTLTYNIGS